VKINIGAGQTQLDGFVAIDRKTGGEAFPLSNDGKLIDADSADEIRASHILEHFPNEDVGEVLKNWVDVLKPGARIRISVPDIDKILAMRESGDDQWARYLMGGHIDANDYHSAVFSSDSLTRALEDVGLVNVKPWHSDNTDMAAHACSLNLEGEKPKDWAKALDVKISALMSIPRYGCNASRGCIEATLSPFHIPLRCFSGAFWGHCLQNAFEDTIDETDWFLVFDYDTMCTPDMLSQLMTQLGQNPQIDALAAIQCRRHGGTPLMTIGKKTSVEIDGAPVRVDTAHFGMTLIRTVALRRVALPWFWEVPRASGGWRDDKTTPHGLPVDERFAQVVGLYGDYFQSGKYHIDPDIWFWKRWAEAGNTVYVAPSVKVGHLEEIVADFDDSMEPRHSYAHKWRERYQSENE